MTAQQVDTPVRLRHSSDAKPGLWRERHGDGFRYCAPDGSEVDDPEVLRRIRSLAVPPAWTDVWICADANGHLQTTGRDARGRKQYRYHPAFRQRRETAKYERMSAFGRVLPKIRRRVDHDLARRGLPREKVVAAVVQLLDRTYIRVGNEEYAKANRSYGLTTLRNRHVRVDGTEIRFRFRGKSGRMHEVGLRDRRLAAVVRRCRDLPGQELFEYVDDNGEPRTIESADVNEYLREAAGIEITAKDFRTWAGTLLAFRALRAAAPGSARESKRTVRVSTEQVAEALGNTPAVSRKSYIAPGVVDAYLAGSLPPALVRAGEAAERARPQASRQEELALVRLLESGRLHGRSKSPAPKDG
jgi:DNA topoisomerase I